MKKKEEKKNLFEGNGLHLKYYFYFVADFKMLAKKTGSCKSMRQLFSGRKERLRQGFLFLSFHSRHTSLSIYFFSTEVLVKIWDRSPNF
jgi:hypothetical protein